VVILTYDATVSGTMWLMADYLPEVAELDMRIFPSPQQLTEWLGAEVRIEKLPIPRDTPDWMLGSFWAHPERVSTRRRARPHPVSRACRPTSLTASCPKWRAT